jgi:putative ATP-dependent endonuclease of the OLD family
MLSIRKGDLWELSQRIVVNWARAPTRISHITANRMMLKYFGRAEEDFPSAIVADEVAIFEERIETYLSASWPEWLMACEEVRAVAGINFRKNQLAYRTATLMAKGAVPEMLKQILKKTGGE